MTQQDRTAVQYHEMTETPIPRLILSLAAPTILSMLITSIYNLADTFFVGQISTSASGAVGVVSSLMAIIQALGFMLGHGSGTIISRRLGSQDTHAATRFASTSFFTALAFGVVLAVVGLATLPDFMMLLGSTETILPHACAYARYILLAAPIMMSSLVMNNILRYEGKASFAMIGLVTGGLLNIALDPLFIFGLDMGMTGAALATILGQIASFCISMRYLFHFKSVPFSRGCFTIDGDRTRKIFSYGASACFNQIAMAVVQIVLNNTLAHYGALSIYGSDIPLACAGIISKVNMIFMSFVIGISQGVQPIIGFNYGAALYRRVKKSYLLALAVATGLSLAAFACFQLFPRQIISIFGTGSEMYYQFSERYFRIYMFLTLINGIQPVTSNFFNSIGKARLGVFMSLTRQILFLLPLIVIFPLFMGIDGVMYAGPIADGAAAIVCGFFTVRELRELTRLQQKTEKMN